MTTPLTVYLPFNMDCLRGYFRKTRLFERNPCAALAL